MIKIIGAKGEIQNIDKFLKQINNFSKKNNLLIQAFNADLIYGKNHLLSAYEHANRSFENKTNTTNSLEMEILLYASGDRQIKIAIPKMGINTGKSNIAFVFIAEKISKKIIEDLLSITCLSQDDKVLKGNLNTLKKFGISENEIKTITKEKYEDLILEKIAMVDIIK